MCGRSSIHDYVKRQNLSDGYREESALPHLHIVVREKTAIRVARPKKR